MKKLLVILLVLALGVGAFVYFDPIGLFDDPTPTPTPKDDPTTITYTASSLADAIVGKTYTGSVATATGPKGITYKLKEGSSLPDGLTLSRAGRLGGTATTTGTYEFTVVASAEGVDSVEATFKITVYRIRLNFKSAAIASGIVGEAYKDSVATASGADVITYRLKEGSTLPAGLTLSEDGTISGTPLDRADAHSFVVVAEAEGFDPTEAEFVISVTYTIYKYQAEWALTDKAESGALHSPIKNNSDGNGFVDFVADKCDYSAVKFTFTSDKAGLANLTFCVGLRADASCQLPGLYKVVINGQEWTPDDVNVPISNNNKISWFDWTEFAAGRIPLVAGENTILIVAKKEPRCLDYIAIEPTENQKLYWENCTDNFEGAEYGLPITDLSSLGKVFGDDYVVTEIYDVNEFHDAVIGTERTNIVDSFGSSVAVGNRFTLKVVATKGEETRSILLPVVITDGINRVKIEAEDGELASGVRDGETINPIVGTGNGAEGEIGGFVDFIGTGTSVEFTFTASEASLATLTLRFGRNDTKRMLSDTYKILVNGVEITYDAEIDKNAAGSKNWYDWFSLVIGEKITINEGENTIKIIGTASPLILDNLTLQFDSQSVEITH